MIADEFAGNWQHKTIMNLGVADHPLYWGPAALWGYFTAGHKMTHTHMRQMQRKKQSRKQQRESAAAGRNGGRTKQRAK